MSTILVIEDDHPLREQVLEWLELEGYQGLGAEDGLSGLALAREHHPDLIICDVMMPQMNGFSVITTLRQEANTAAIPVIFLTALVTDKGEQRGRELGAVDYITKPFLFKDLLQTIQLHV